MNVTCPECRTIYRIDPGKVPARGVIARCARCPGEFVVALSEEEPDSFSPAGDLGHLDAVADSGSVPEPAYESPAVEGHASEAGVVAGSGYSGWEAPAEEGTRQDSPIGYGEEESYQDASSGPEVEADNFPEAAPEPDYSVTSGFDGPDPSATPTSREQYGYDGETASSEEDADAYPVVEPRSDLETGSTWEDSWRRSDSEAPVEYAAEATGYAESVDVPTGPSDEDLALTSSAYGDPEPDLESDSTEPPLPASGDYSQPVDDDSDRIELVGVEEVATGALASEAESTVETVDSSYTTGADLPADDYAAAAPETSESASVPESDFGSEDAAPAAGMEAEPVAIGLHAPEEEAAKAGFSVAPPPAAGEVDLPPAPFGSTDPHSRARRLARALVSDIVVYHPDRRERSLRDGTLRQEFREEIRKSWDEYVANVGDQLARDTTYFRDALNDLLAGGSRLF